MTSLENDIAKGLHKSKRRAAIRLKLNNLSPSDAYSYFCQKVRKMSQEDFASLLVRFKTLYDLVIAFKRAKAHEESLSTPLWPRGHTPVPTRHDRDHIITSGGGVHNLDENVKWDISRDSHLTSVDCCVINQIGPSGNLSSRENLIIEVRSAGCQLVIHPMSDNCVRIELKRRR